jgi:hypothetical protein
MSVTEVTQRCAVVAGRRNCCKIAIALIDQLSKRVMACY